MSRVLHLADAAEWQVARRHGWYRRSTRDATLDEVGYIHASTSAQVRAVAQRFYADAPDPLVLLVIDVPNAEEAGTPVRWEEADGQLFPHFYGPVPAAAVVAALPVSFDANRRFELPDLSGYDVEPGR